MIEEGKHYMAGALGAEWLDDGGWFILNLSTGNAVGWVDNVEELLKWFPEFEHAEEVQ